MYRIDRNDDTALYKQIADQIKEKITKEKLNPGDQIPAEMEFVNELGVSRNTVRQALLSLTEEGLLVRKRGKGTYVRLPSPPSNEDDYPSIRDKTPLLVLQLGEKGAIYNPFYRIALRGLEKRLKSKPYRLIYNTVLSPEDIEELKVLPLVEGVILAGISQKSLVEPFQRKGLPIIGIHEPFPGENIPAALVDNVHGAYMATEHLIEQGCRNIVFIWAEFSSASFIDRHKGYKLALERNNIEYDPELVLNGKSNQFEAMKALEEFMAKGFTFDSVFASTDIMAMGVYRALDEAGKDIPRDVKVVGYDDQFFASLLYPSLTTIRQNEEELGMKAADLMLKLLEDNNRELKDVYVEPELIIRESSLFPLKEVRE